MVWSCNLPFDSLFWWKTGRVRLFPLSGTPGHVHRHLACNHSGSFKTMRPDDVCASLSTEKEMLPLPGCCGRGPTRCIVKGYSKGARSRRSSWRRPSSPQISWEFAHQVSIAFVRFSTEETNIHQFRILDDKARQHGVYRILSVGKQFLSSLSLLTPTLGCAKWFEAMAFFFDTDFKVLPLHIVSGLRWPALSVSGMRSLSKKAIARILGPNGP